MKTQLQKLSENNPNQIQTLTNQFDIEKIELQKKHKTEIDSLNIEKLTFQNEIIELKKQNEQKQQQKLELKSYFFIYYFT